MRRWPPHFGSPIPLRQSINLVRSHTFLVDDDPCSDSQPGAFCELASFGEHVHDLKLRSDFNLAPVILYYDFVLTFSQEIAHIWPRPLSRPALLFFINRYPMLFGNVAFILFDIVGIRVTSKVTSVDFIVPYASH